MGNIAITLPGRICFTSGKADLMTPARGRLDIIGDIIVDEYAGIDIRVEGHTDAARR